jgi:hypothetical protein
MLDETIIVSSYYLLAKNLITSLTFSSGGKTG